MSRNHFSYKVHIQKNLFLLLYADSPIRNEIRKLMLYLRFMNRLLLIGCSGTGDYNLVCNKALVSHNTYLVLVMVNENFPSILFIKDCYKMKATLIDKVDWKD